MQKIIYPIRGLIVSIFITLSTLITAISILFFAIFVYIIPNKTWRHYGTAFLLKIPIWWIDFNSLILQLSTAGKWSIAGKGELKPQGWYLMVSNHRSWIDILTLDYAFNHKIPIRKFFMKKELLWSLPIAGVVCYILGYPFMNRHSKSEIRKRPELKGKDIETTKKACRQFKEHPTTVINFVEGTRFREHKKIKQKSPFKHLLKPKAGGIAIVLQELENKLDGIINVTIDYQPHTLTLWEFVCGNFDKAIVRYEVLPVTKDLVGDYYTNREFRSHFQQWLTHIWQQKDNLLTEIRKSHS